MFTLTFQFTVYISHGLGNSQILKLTFEGWEGGEGGWCLLFKKNTTIKGYSVRGLKELKRLSEDTQIREENNLCQILFQINSQSSSQ